MNQRWRTTAWQQAAAVACVGLMACTGASPTATGGDAQDSADVAQPDAIAVKPVGDPAAAAFFAAFQPVQALGKTMTLAQFLAAHTPADAAVPITPGYKPLDAKYMPLIDTALALTAAEKARIAEVGFMVSDRLQKPTMAEALLDVYQKDLPVLVTTDMILQALHASYDDILRNLEQFVLVGQMTEVLAQSHAALATLDLGPSPQAKEARQDADFFLTVARSLLTGTTQPSLGGAVMDAEVGKFLGYVKGLQLQEVQIFGTKRVMDFSQFQPRGHYEGVPELEHYFRAMMWLGRADLRFAERDVMAGQWLYHPRQVMAALLLDQATQAGGAMAGWQSADDLVGLMVGPVDYIDIHGVEKLAKAQGWQTASDIATMTPAQVDAMLAALLGGQYGSQRIASHWLETDPQSSETTPLPPSFAFLGQRFVVDSYVFSNVVYDRLVYDGKKVLRVLPNPLDALFVLGNDQVLPLLAPDFAQFPYWGALHDLRWLVDSYDAAFWQGNVYNVWLDSLRKLNAPTTGPQFPYAMRTPAWRDKTAQTQLASWAQLRHDTLLYAKQSYTGVPGCEHPAGFVEPYPAFFQRLEDLADVAGQVLTNAKWQDPGMKTQLTQFFANWKARMGTLRQIAQKELAGQDPDAQDQKFLKETVMSNQGCAGPVFGGWYVSLFFDGTSFAKWKPTIADVHTNPNQGDLPGPDVLHVATGNVSLMVFTVDTCQGAEAFVGPVFRYHEVDVKKIERLTDKAWEGQLQDGTAPAPPVWTQSFRVAP
jgi:hypothetical protein